MYTILYATTAAELEKQVNKLVKAGYKPLGGVSINNTGAVWRSGAHWKSIDRGFFQAMFKDKEN